jgi:hypothetical protein
MRRSTSAKARYPPPPGWLGADGWIAAAPVAGAAWVVPVVSGAWVVCDVVGGAWVVCDVVGGA